mgnify:CR=1 FL=1
MNKRNNFLCIGAVHPDYILKLKNNYCVGDLMLTGKKPYPIWLADHPGQKYKGKGWKGWTGFFKDTL